MEAIKKISALLFVFAGLLLFSSKVTAQCYNGPFIGQPRYELQTEPLHPYLSFMQGPGGCPLTAGTATLPGVGINNGTNIQFMLDILCDAVSSSPTNLDVNISCPTCPNTQLSTGANATGYRIGDSMMLWHGGVINGLGITSSLFVGIHAGGLDFNQSGADNPV